MRLDGMSLSSPKVDAADGVDHVTVDTGAEVHLDEWIAPELVDENGFLRVGRILEWMDVGGSLAAVRYCRQLCVTASVNGVDIYQPIAVGEHVSMTARVVHTSRRSIGVHVSLRARGAKLLSESEVLSAYMTFVPVAAQKGQLEPVKPYTPTTPRDRALYRQGELRREFRQKLAAGDFPEGAGRARVARERLSLRTFARDVRRIVQDTGRSSNACSPELSYVHRVEPVMAGSLNVHGTLYGGTLMRWIENAASLSARAFTDTSMMVVGVHGLDFQKPVSRDVFLHTHAMAVRADNDSITIRVEVTSENPMTGSIEQNLFGYFTYRPVDRRAVVPKLALQSDAEHALSAEATHHLAFSRRLRAQ